MKMCRNYLQHVLSALWRRKSGALAFIMAATVLVLLIQYHSVQHESLEHSALHPKNIAAQRMLRTLDSHINLSDKDNGPDKDTNNNKNQHSTLPELYQISVKHPEENLFKIQQVVAPFNQLPADQGGEPNKFLPSDIQNRQFPRNKFQFPDRVPEGNKILNQDIEGETGNDFHPKKINFDKLTGDDVPREKMATRKSYDSSQNNAAPAQTVAFDRIEPLDGNMLQPKIFPAQQLPVNSFQSMAQSQEPYIPKHRLFHLDLKGAPPKVSYLKKLFPILKQFGATGVLLEYEDMFPYEGDLAVVAAKNHYSKQDVKDILKLAKEQDLEVIPLVQTFGHLEFILKERDYGHLREVPNIPNAICPSRNETMPLLEEMIDQVMALHPNIRWLHIGLDEVFQLGTCSRCMMISMSQGRDVLFLSHVARVASYVRHRHKVIPIMWDDMLHHFTTESLKQFDLGNLVEIMIWTYVQDVYRFIPYDIWAMYGEVFPYVWSASAFKGAFGEALVVPPVKRHIENNLAWLDVMAREQSRFKEFRGIAITGWQRYDHFATLCELLPASVPSLSLSLLTVSHGYFNESWMQPLYDGLQCMKSPKYTTFVNLDQDPYLWEKMSWCFFPGVTFFKVTQRLINTRKAVTDFLLDETVKKAWLSEYNVRHNYSNIPRIDASLSNFPFHYSDVENLIRNSRDALREVYDEYVVAEWIEQNIYPYLRKLELFRQTAESLKKASVWPARPLDPLPELHKYGIGISTDNPSQTEE